MEKPTHKNFKDLEGMRFDKLTVKAYAGRLRGSHAWSCICDCGNTVIRQGKQLGLSRYESKSCGCVVKEKAKTARVSHGMTNTKTFRAWSNMKNRTQNPNHPAYHRYGGRGVGVCERWLKSFSFFLEDMGECPEGLTLERINNSGNYEPGNCKWATWKEQAANKTYRW